MKKPRRTALRGMISPAKMKMKAILNVERTKMRSRTTNLKKNYAALLQIPGSCMEHSPEELRYSIY
jgi:hypothetical protein